MFVNYIRVRRNVWKLQNRKIIKKHQKRAKHRTKSNKNSQNQGHTQKCEPPFIYNISYRQNIRTQKPLKKSAKCLGISQIPRRGPIWVQYFCNTSVKHKPPHRYSKNKQRCFLKINHNLFF